MNAQAKYATAVMENWLSHLSTPRWNLMTLPLHRKMCCNGSYDLMINLCSYLIKKGAVLHDGETSGFTMKQKLPITLSDGIYVEGPSLKIGF